VIGRLELMEEDEEEERGLIKDLKRQGQLAVAWERHGSPVPRWTLTRCFGKRVVQTAARAGFLSARVSCRERKRLFVNETSVGRIERPVY
jgi:hypothetical protein